MFNDWSTDRKVIWMALATFYIKALWVLHPDVLLGFGNLPEYQFFPFAREVKISVPTYISMICEKASWLIVVRIWWILLPKYRLTVTILFVILSLQFFQFFIDYNKAYLWVNIGRHQLDIDLTLAKLTIPVCILLYQETWKDK